MTNRFEVAIVARDEFSKPLATFTKRTREAFGDAGKSAGATGRAWRKVGQDIEDAVEVVRRPEPGGEPAKRPGSGATPRFNSAVPRALVDGADAAGMLGRNGASGFLGALAGGSLLGAGVAAAGAIAGSVNKNIATARAAQLYGLDPTMLQSWAGAAEVANHSRDSMQGAMTNMAQTMYGIRNRPNEYVRQRMVLQKLGIDERMGPDQVMLALTQILPELKPGQRRTVASELGIDSDALGFLSKGTMHLRRRRGEAAAAGLVMDEEQLKRSEGAGEQRAGIASKVQGVVNQAVDGATKLIEDVGDFISRRGGAKPADSGASAPAQIDVNVQVHGLPPGASASATAKPRDDTSRPRINNNRANNAP